MKKLLAFLMIAIYSQLSFLQSAAQAPTITSFSPASGPVGTLITITGTNLTTPTAFTIGGVSAIRVSGSATSLVGMVMPGAGTGSVAVTTAGGSATGASNFTVTATTFPYQQQGNKLVGTGNTGAASQGKSVAVSADGNTAIVGGVADNSNQGAVWIYTRTGSIWTQQGGKLVGTGNTGAAEQGTSVAISADGNTAIVGGVADNSNQGAAWIFTRSGSTWTQQGSKLVGTGNIGAAFKGISVDISADGNTAIIGGYADNSNQGAAWVFIRSGSTWSQQGNKLVGTGNTGAARQGISVGISDDGNTAIIGGYVDNNQQGAVWIFTRSGSTWSQQGNKLVGTGNTGAAFQGSSVALSADGNTAIVGGIGDNSFQGASWIFIRTGSTWSQQGSKLVGTGNTGVASQGNVVAISADGNKVVVGGYSDNGNIGAVWIYTRSGSVWSQQGNKLVGSGTIGSATLGRSVAISADGNTAIFGGNGDNSNQGAAWAFTVPPPTITSFTPSSGTVGSLVTITGTNLGTPGSFTIGGATAIVVSSTGTQVVGLVMPGATTGAISFSAANGTATSAGNFTVTATPFPSSQQGGKLVGTGNTGAGSQGWAVAISADGNTAIVGAPGDNSSQGAVWIYTRSGSTWSQQGSKLVGTGNTGAAQQGRSVAISADGNTAIVGGYNDNNTVGAAWVFTRSGSTWSQQGSKLVGTGSVGGSQQGFSVGISADGNTAIVCGNRDNSAQGAGWVYVRSGTTWSQQGSKLVGTGVVGLPLMGFSVALSADGNTAILGGTDDNGFMGAAWVFTRSGTTWSQQGSKLVGTSAGGSLQGQSVAISADGNTAMIGGYNDNGGQGAGWIFTRSGSTWSQQGKLVGTGNVGAAQQGRSVALSADGNTAMIGGGGDNTSQGAIWIFTRSGGTWSQQGGKLVGTGNVGAAQQGRSLAISANGSTAITGGIDDNNFNGAVWMYTISAIPTIIGKTTTAAFTTTYGTASAVQTVSVSGFSLAANLVATAPAGFEVSSDGTTYGSTATFTTSSGTAGGSLRIRLAATASVSGSYNAQNIVLSSTGATSVNITTAASGNAVSAAALTITGVTANNRSYNGLTTATVSGAPSYVGLKNGESFSVSGTPAATFNTAAAGNNKPVTVTGYTAPNGNYTVSQPSGLTANITAAPLTITGLTANNKEYDGLTTATLSGTPLYAGLQNGESFSVSGTPVANFTTAAAGNVKPVNVTGYTTPNGNYIVLQPSGLTANITTAALTITGLTANNKVYDGLTTATISGTPSYVGLKNGESFSVSGTPAATFNNAAVGNNKPVTVTGYTAPNSNYTVSQPSGLTANITAAALTITGITADDKVYDGLTTATLSGTPLYVGLQNGETFSVSGTPVATFNNAAVGNNKPVTVTGFTAPNGNYTLSQPTGLTANITGLAQSTADYRSKADGNFSSVGPSGVWEYNQCGASWVDATQAPVSTNNISINHNLLLDQDYTVGTGKSFVIGTGGTLVVNATRTLSVAGAADFGGRSVTVASNSNGTAALGQVTGTVSGATNVTVERYIPNNGFRSWRLLSVPTFGGQTIRQAWQEGDVNPLPQQNNVANYGTQITGAFTTQAAAAAAGFDSTSVQAGLLSWSGTAWSNVTTTNQSLVNANKSWFMYIRGDRSKGVTGSLNNTSATTLRTRGTIYTGDQVTNVGVNAFALVPNVYPSAINFTGITRTGGVNNLFYIWDSKKLNGSSLGVYQTFSATNSFNCLVAGGSYTVGQPNTVIESGQSFFVTSGAAGTITLKESAKISGTNGNLGFRPIARPKMDTRLYNSLDEMADANTVVFDAAYSKDVAAEDAPKMGNPGANFAIENNSRLLAIEGTEPVKENDIIQFRMWNLAKGNYKLELVPGNLAAEGLTAILEDNYLKTATVIDLGGTTTVNFTIDNKAASSAVNRFRVVFRRAVSVVIGTKQGYTIAPNPVENGIVNLQFNNQPAGNYRVNIVGNNGQSVLLKSITHTGGSSNYQVELPQLLSRGTYQVEIAAPANTRTVQSLFVNKK